MVSRAPMISYPMLSDVSICRVFVCKVKLQKKWFQIGLGCVHVGCGSNFAGAILGVVLRGKRRADLSNWGRSLFLDRVGWPRILGWQGTSIWGGVLFRTKNGKNCKHGTLET